MLYDDLDGQNGTGGRVAREMGQKFKRERTYVYL